MNLPKASGNVYYERIYMDFNKLLHYFSMNITKSLIVTLIALVIKYLAKKKF